MLDAWQQLAELPGHSQLLFGPSTQLWAPGSQGLHAAIPPGLPPRSRWQCLSQPRTLALRDPAGLVARTPASSAQEGPQGDLGSLIRVPVFGIEGGSHLVRSDA